MKELLDNLPLIHTDHKLDFLIDTCFFVYIFEHNKEKDFHKFLEENDCGITSFNAEELMHIEHKINDHTRNRMRKFFHNEKRFFLLEIPVHPGSKEQELNFVRLVIPDLDKTEHDPSDAVLLAAAIKIGANVLTRDKHDIFNSRLKNFLEKNGISVYNKFV